MAFEKNVGKFKIQGSEPWPVWCSLEDDRGNEIKFTHEELNDLIYGLTELKKYAKQELTPKNLRNDSELL